MRRFILGMALLSILLFFGMAVTKAADNALLPISQVLDKAASACMEGDFSRGQTLAGAARQDWEGIWKYTAVFSDHAPMDEIDGLFAQLETFRQEQQVQELAACCAQLSQLVQAVADAHRPTWWNFF